MHAISLQGRTVVRMHRVCALEGVGAVCQTAATRALV